MKSLSLLLLKFMLLKDKVNQKSSDAEVEKVLRAEVKAAVENSTYYVICTNDTERKWTMKELLSIYKKQSVVERNRRCIKDKRLLVNTLYLESPSRINALMWVMTLALLIYSATEYLMRKKMEEQRLTVPTPDHKNELSRPSLMRVYQYLANSNISLTYSPGTEFVRLT